MKFDPAPHLEEIVRRLNDILGSPTTDDHPTLKQGVIHLFGLPLTDDHLHWVKEQREVGAWRSEFTGRMRLRVAGPPKGRHQFSQWSGPLPSWRSFTPLKDGTYDYVEVAERLHDWQKLYVSWKRMEETKKSNLGLMESLRDELGRLPPGVVIEASGSADQPVTLRISRDFTLTVEKARALVTKLRRVL